MDNKKLILVGILGIVMLLFGSFQLRAQTLTYDLSLDDNVIGSLTVTRTTQGNTMAFDAKSSVTLHLFGETTITIGTTVLYEKDVLQSSTYTVEKDGKPYKQTTVQYADGGYTVDNDGVVSKIDGPITASTIRLYYEEPKAPVSIFAELEGIFKSLDALGGNTFELLDPNGNHRNTYVYNKGILSSGQVQHTLYNLTFALREP
ncbi:DUF6134 family protein [Flagellimonas beolgyonensis]|uniref:DUF6134 family protein n=1 Tax=Flagellimonas beolgyonensis TaxID=864064 RepID=UPI003D65E710